MFWNRHSRCCCSLEPARCPELDALRACARVGDGAGCSPGALRCSRGLRPWLHPTGCTPRAAPQLHRSSA